jgi:hypothetical protein
MNHVVFNRHYGGGAWVSLLGIDTFVTRLALYYAYL